MPDSNPATVARNSSSERSNTYGQIGHLRVFYCRICERSSGMPAAGQPLARLSSVLDFTFAALELNHPMIISRSNFLPGTVISTIVATAIISFLVACGDPKYQAPA